MLDIAQTASETVILTEEEASLYLQASRMRVWAVKGQTPVIKTDTGRSLTHFYGSLNLWTGQENVMRSSQMNSEVTALYLEQLLVAYPDCPLLLLWDRASWHRGAAVVSVLEANPRLEVLWFAPGSPELNPQEPVWKSVREAVSHNHQMTKLSDLADAFEAHLKQTRFPCSLLEKHNCETLSMIFK